MAGLRLECTLCHPAMVFEVDDTTYRRRKWSIYDLLYSQCYKIERHSLLQLFLKRKTPKDILML